MSAAPTNEHEVYRTLFEAYPEGVLLVDAQGRVVLANTAVTKLLGYAPQALVGQSVDTLVPLGVAPRHAAYRQGYARAPRSRPMGTDLELMARCADGSEVMVEIALSPLRQHGADYVVASVRSIGEYPRVKRALQRARYNEFLAQLGREAVDALDADELLQRAPGTAAQALNADAVAVFLLTPNQLELRIETSSGLSEALVAQATQPNRPDTAMGWVVAQRAPLIASDFELEHRVEAPAWLRAAGLRAGMAVPINDRGRVIGVLCALCRQPRTFEDAEVVFLEALSTLLSTSLQRAQAEVQMRHAQRLESVGQLTGGIAHDFNNLLTVIQGNLQMLGDQDAVRVDALLGQLVGAAQRAGQRGADLTGKLLAFSRRQALAPAAVDPRVMLASMAEMLRRTLGEQVRVVLRLPASCPPCRADAVQLESALLNVALNARDAMPGGGTLTLRCGSGLPPHKDVELAAPDEATPMDAVWFSVQDDGAGMSPGVRDRAFEPFFTTKEAGRGTGLGLSTVYGFIKQSHGSVHIDSSPGAGTTVTMVLPALPPSAEAAQAAAVAVARLPKGLRVLLVEDDDDVRGVAQAFLQGLGLHVTACATAEEALDLFTKGAAFDLLFSDITLGSGLDGIALAQRVEQQRPGLAVLLCSGYSHYLAGGGGARDQPLPWAVLKKPYTREQLVRALTKCLAPSAGVGASAPAPAPSRRR